MDSISQTVILHFQSNVLMVKIASIIAYCFGSSVGILLGGTVVLLIFFYFKNRPAAIWLASTATIAIIGNIIIKIFIGRVRPETHRIDTFAIEYGMSFPSGHTTFATVLAGCLCLIIIQNLRTRLGGILVVILTIVLIVLTMISRVLIGVHYPSDTIGGVLWGTFVIRLTYPIFLRFKNNN